MEVNWRLGTHLRSSLITWPSKWLSHRHRTEESYSAGIIANLSTYNRALDIISYKGFGMLMLKEVCKNSNVRKIIVEKIKSSVFASYATVVR